MLEGHADATPPFRGRSTRRSWRRGRSCFRTTGAGISPVEANTS